QITLIRTKQAHEHHVVVSAAQKYLLPLDAFLCEAEGAIEAQRAFVERDYSQIELMQVEHLKGVVDNERERVPGQPLAVPAALADQDAEFGIAREPIDIVEINEADERAIGLVFDRQHDAAPGLILEHGVNPLGLHCLGDGKAITKNVVANVRIVAPA